MSADKMTIQLRNRTTGEILAETEGTDATYRAWNGGAAQRNRREGVTFYEARIAPEPDDRHKIVDGERVPKTRAELVEDGVITQTEADEQAAEEVRQKRDGLIRNTDYMVMPDSPHDSPAVRKYRQALRDVPQQKGFPHKVTWPEM
jgi:hypothetical protein